jgi:hypothetical protein
VEGVCGGSEGSGRLVGGVDWGSVKRVEGRRVWGVRGLEGRRVRVVMRIG